MRESLAQPMPEHEQAKQQQVEQAAPQQPARQQMPPGMALNSAIGNRAMSRMVQRMEATEAVDALEKATAPGVLGAERQVLTTLTAFSMDNAGFDKVACEYQKKTKMPLRPTVSRLHTDDGHRAGGATPKGFYESVSGEKYPEPEK